MVSILEACNVGFAYSPEKWAIREMSFVLSEPRRICLLGANGVGKSTLMLLLNGTLRPYEGELLVLGQPLDYSKSGLQRIHRQVGIVLQDPDDQLFGATVEQDVAFGPLNNGFSSPEARELVRKTLADLAILHLIDRPIHELSLGEKKRVALAGVLVLNPKVLLLDEPTAGLDLVGVTSMLNLLARLHEGGTTIVISTHDTDLAYEWGEEAWVLMDGQIAARGPVCQVLRDRELLSAAHLRFPWMVEVGLAIQAAFPDLAGQPLPVDRDGVMELILQSRDREGALLL